MATSVALVDCCDAGLYIHEGELELIDSLVERTRECGSAGEGVLVGSNVLWEWARLTGNAILDNNSAGIASVAATLEARGNLVRGNRAGLLVSDGSRTTLVDNAVVHNKGVGVNCDESAPGLLVEGNLLEGNGQAEGSAYVETKNGLGIYDSPDAQVRGNAAVANYGAGIAVYWGSVLLTDNLVEATRATDLLIRSCGEGLELAGAVAAEVEGLAALGNTTRGLWLGGAGQQVDVRRSLVAGTQPRPLDSELGCGVVVQAGGQAPFEDVVIRDNHLAAMLVLDSSVTLRESRLAETLGGSFTSLVCPQKPCDWNVATVHHGIADGLIAASSSVDLSDVRVSGCSRAGALFHASSGSIDGVTSTDNGFGLVLQGSPRPDVFMDSCVFDPNAEQDVLTDSELAIPNASSELPEAPSQ